MRNAGEDFVQHGKIDGLAGIADSGIGTAVGLDDEAVSAGGDGSEAEGFYHEAAAGAVGGIDDDGEVAELLYQRHGRDVEGVAGKIFVGTYAPFAQYHIRISSG